MGPFSIAVARALERIEADRSGAVVTICPEAVDAARRLEGPGPLAGLPFTAKDVLASADTPSQAGGRALAGLVANVQAAAAPTGFAAGAVQPDRTPGS